MSTGAKLENQAATKGAEGGGNLGNKDPKAPTLYQPANFMGKSGMPDNQSTDRAKGMT